MKKVGIFLCGLLAFLVLVGVVNTINYQPPKTDKPRSAVIEDRCREQMGYRGESAVEECKDRIVTQELAEFMVKNQRREEDEIERVHSSLD